MKKFNIKFKPEALITVATVGLGIAQMVLTNKKEASDRAKIKTEILEEIMGNLPEKKD